MISENTLPARVVQRGGPGLVVRLLVVPVYEGESDNDALAALRKQESDTTKAWTKPVVTTYPPPSDIPKPWEADDDQA